MPPGEQRLGDVMLSSGILHSGGSVAAPSAMGAAGAGSGAGAAGFGDVDPNMDPELAMVWVSWNADDAQNAE